MADAAGDAASAAGNGPAQLSSEPHDHPMQEAAPPTAEPAAEAPALSKNAMKKLRKKQAWEDGRQHRAQVRKEKRKEQRTRKRLENRDKISQGVDPSVVYPKKPPAVQAPLALILDCDFEQYMLDKERVSLASQITRSYSDNRAAKYKAHLWISGWRGKLRDRFENVLGDQASGWRGVGFEEKGFLEAARRARAEMKEKPGEMIEALRKGAEGGQPCLTRAPAAGEGDEAPAPAPEPELDPEFKDVVYLSSDSPYTIQRLEPNTSYVIGGLVDKNREKGLCHRRATELGIRTARLPIGEFMVMQSRQVLATNHVVEIMLKWLECEDWGEAFVSVIPKRKGGKLKGEDAEGGDREEEEGEDAGEEADGEEDTEKHNVQGEKEREPGAAAAVEPAAVES